MITEPGTPLSAPQGGIWFNEQLDEVGAVHNMPFALRFEGELDVAALSLACDAVLARHPVLAGAVRESGGVPYLVRAGQPPRLLVEEWSRESFEEHLRRPFDLAGGSLCRLVLLVQGPSLHQLLVVAHHLVFDGRSTDVFVADLAACYRAAVEGGTPGLAALPEPSPPEDGDVAAARAYWAQRWREPDEVVLPGLGRLEQAVQEGEAVGFRVEDRVRKDLASTAEKLEVTPFELIVAVTHAVLYRYGNHRPVTALDLGIRSERNLDRIGVHVNELPFASAPSPSRPFAEFAHSVRRELRELYRVRQVPLSRAAAGVRPGVALAPVSLTYRRRIACPSFTGVTASATWVIFNGVARNALRIHLVDGPEGLGVMLQYPSGAIDREDVRRIARHGLAVLEQVAGDPQIRLGELEVTGREEHALLVTEWNRTGADHPAATVPQLVAEHAARAPGALAVVCGATRLTYGELDAAADRLAARLREHGAGPGELVALCARRSERLLVGLLAVLKTGAAYLPLDPDYPADRLDHIMADSGARLLLADPGLRTGPVTIPLEDPASGIGIDAGTGAGPRDRAYVIYTSGSTGRPKGVEVEHGALTNLLWAMRAHVGQGRWLAVTSLSFDISALELFLPLITGETVVVAGEADVKDGAALGRLAAEHGVTHLQATPSTWRMLLDAGFDGQTITAVTGGEALPPPLAARLRPRVGRLFNAYGPTETTIWSMLARVPSGPAEVTIGRPLDNTRLHVLDDGLRPVPVGIPGELYIAGDGLARGYLNRPGLTAERFVPDPHSARGGRLYRTGDRVRYRSDGELEYLGRLDDQVKVRGHRIEPGEIETCLLSHPSVSQAAVVAADDGDRLVAYVVGQAVGQVVIGDLRRHLARTLPAFMIPSAFAELPGMPLTPNGKLDRAALPEPPSGMDDPPDAPPGGSPAGEATSVEIVHQIWCEVLGLDDLGVDEDLFELGGHSLTMTQIAARIRSRLHVDVPLHVFFDEPTVTGIAAVVARLRAAG